jgi:hypothetical protein
MHELGIFIFGFGLGGLSAGAAHWLGEREQPPPDVPQATAPRQTFNTGRSSGPTEAARLELRAREPEAR